MVRSAGSSCELIGEVIGETEVIGDRQPNRTPHAVAHGARTLQRRGQPVPCLVQAVDQLTANLRRRAAELGRQEEVLLGYPLERIPWCRVAGRIETIREELAG
jgi:hypothetical protein